MPVLLASAGGWRPSVENCLAEEIATHFAHRVIDFRVSPNRGDDSNAARKVARVKKTRGGNVGRERKRWDGSSSEIKDGGRNTPSISILGQDEEESEEGIKGVCSWRCTKNGAQLEPRASI